MERKQVLLLGAIVGVILLPAYRRLTIHDSDGRFVTALSVNSNRETVLRLVPGDYVLEVAVRDRAASEQILSVGTTPIELTVE